MPLSLKALITRRVLGWEEIPDQPPRLKIVTETGWITARGGGGGSGGEMSTQEETSARMRKQNQCASSSSSLLSVS